MDEQRDRRLTAGVRSVVALFREFEQAAREADMSVAQYRLLLFLRNGPRRAGELAAEAMVRKPSVTPTIAALERNGWITRESDPGDRRSVRLTISEAGLARMHAFEARLGGVIEEVLGAGAERDTVLDAFDTLYRLLGRTREARFRTLEEEVLDESARDR